MTSENRTKHSFRWIYPYEYPLLLYCLIAFIVAKCYNLQINWFVFFDITYDIQLAKIAIPIMLFYVAFVVQRTGGSSGDQLKFLRRYFANLFTPAAIRPFLLVLYEFFRAVLAIKVCLMVYCHLKQEIPVLNPNLFDDTLWQIDRWVHFGFSPVNISLQLLSAPWIALLIDKIYTLWYTLKAPFLLYFILLAKSEQRMHFITCYLLLWMIGGAFAIAYPSLGPVYTNPELFKSLNTPTAHKLQQMLWKHYQQLLANPTGYRIFIYEGIAAFPSLHVAIAVLFTIAVKEHKWAFRLMVFFSLSIQIGSVLLGWHYAVDGYFGALMAIAIFLATRQFWPELKQESVRDSQKKKVRLLKMELN